MTQRDPYEKVLMRVRGILETSEIDREKQMMSEQFMGQLNEVLDPANEDGLVTLDHKKLRLCQLLLAASEADFAALADRLTLLNPEEQYLVTVHRRLDERSKAEVRRTMSGMADKGPAGKTSTDKAKAMERLLSPNILCTGQVDQIADKIFFVNASKPGSDS